MSPVTESDIKELKELIRTQYIDLSNKLENNNMAIANLDRRLSESILNLDKRLTESLANINKAIEVSINSLDKRVSNQEFIYRAVFISIITVITTSLISILASYFWNHPIV